MDDSLMLATIRDDTWNTLNMQMKGPAHMVEGGHHLRKDPTPAYIAGMGTLGCCVPACCRASLTYKSFGVYYHQPWHLAMNEWSVSILSKMQSNKYH